MMAQGILLALKVLMTAVGTATLLAPLIFLQLSHTVRSFMLIALPLFMIHVIPLHIIILLVDPTFLQIRQQTLTSGDLPFEGHLIVVVPNSKRHSFAVAIGGTALDMKTNPQLTAPLPALATVR